MSVLRSSVGLRAAARPALRAAAVRFASSDASSSASAEAGSSSAPSAPTALPMPWSEYFQMRRRRRLWANLASVPSAAAGLLASASYVANLDADAAGAMLFGLDPKIVMGGLTVAGALGGWLLGPSLGGGLFSLTHPGLARGNPPPLDVMDREFYHRLQSRRADPSRSSVNNPTPDFYGEKIVSIPTYRRWLKDQKAYNRKAAHGVEEEE